MSVPLAITLDVPAETAVGQLIPVAIRVKNISDHQLWTVGVLDGSEAGLRYPHWQPEIITPQPLPDREPVPLSDMSAPLRAQDFRLLKPGESFDPTAANGEAAYLPITAFQNFRPPVPGRYQFKLTLSTASERDEEWLGIVGYPGEEEVLKRLKEVPRTKVVSNTAVVEVK
ncbi:MAG TPA: hypothetical protein VFD58_07510 [Blastocatellia bacterium]|nr:hypothetical protein [Blastocatellia bacterium]